jgi:GTP cyclohydrolase I
MSKQYEKSFAEGKTKEGNGMAVAHSQRSVATCSFFFDSKHNFKTEALVDFIREAIPTETQSLVKRIDEQAFAILNGEHPMFVEHASRRLALVFDKIPNLDDWKVKVEHLESLHSHNAVAYISKDKSQ